MTHDEDEITNPGLDSGGMAEKPEAFGVEESDGDGEVTQVDGQSRSLGDDEPSGDDDFESLLVSEDSASTPVHDAIDESELPSIPLPRSEGS
jgi:hypothetical protein